MKTLLSVFAAGSILQGGKGKVNDCTVLVFWRFGGKTQENLQKNVLL